MISHHQRFDMFMFTNHARLSTAVTVRSARVRLIVRRHVCACTNMREPPCVRTTRNVCMYLGLCSHALVKSCYVLVHVKNTEGVIYRELRAYSLHT